MKLEEVKQLVDQINGVQVDSFSGLIAQLERVPGIQPVKFRDETGVMEILAALFDSSAVAGPQSITLEVRHPRNYSEEFDYEVGFRLGSKWAQLGHGWYSHIVRAVNAKTAKPRDVVPTATPIS